MADSMIFVLVTYAVMLAAFFWAKHRALHIGVMGTIMLIDLAFPVWLVFNRDWYKRLIEQEEILSFMIWMHFMLVLALYALYVMQIMAGRRLLKGEGEVRSDHRTQGIGVLIVRGVVILSAFMLIDPADQG